ncbi:hypothetical protein [Rhodococcus aetherivorans]|uniref:hypothetical protein n=1 Tax=Rhodococcus aetherivorans TaxID=191292 RepID=UPI00388E3761
MSTNDPFAPLRSLSYEQKEALLGLVWVTAVSSVIGTQLIDSLGLGLSRPIWSIVAEAMTEATRTLDGDGDQ